MKRYESCRAVVTGGGSGLGRAICLELANYKAKILVADLKLERAEETVSLVEKAGGEGHAIICDVAKQDEVEQLSLKAQELWQGTDVLVNNAGVPVSGAVGEIPLEDWKWIIDINLMGVIYGCHFFIPGMKKQNKGAILNVASAAGLMSPSHAGPYNVTKAGVVSLTETLKKELFHENIETTVLCPIFFKTNLLENMRAPENSKSVAQKEFDRAKMTAQDVAQIALQDLDKGRLYSIPQKQGKIAWRIQRWMPEYFIKLYMKEQAKRLKKLGVDTP